MKQIRQIKVDTVYHQETDLIVAISDDLRGLMVPARSHEELRAKLPAAIKELLEAEGQTVSEVEALDEVAGGPAGFQTPGFMAKASLIAA